MLYDLSLSVARFPVYDYHSTAIPMRRLNIRRNS